MYQPKGPDWGTIYKGILSQIRYNGELMGKSKTIFNLFFEIDPDQVLIMPEKNWRWAFVELYDRFDSNFSNPGNAYRFRPHWKKKLDNENGEFCYTYNNRLWPTVDRVYDILRKNKYERDAVIPVFDSNDVRRLVVPRTPCTLNLHFYLDYSKSLNLQVNMRANDVVNLLIYDVFHHSMLLRWMSSKLELPIGKYQHFTTIAYYQKKREERGYIDRLLKEDIKYYKIDKIEQFDVQMGQLVQLIRTTDTLGPISSPFMIDLCIAVRSLLKGDKKPGFCTKFFEEVFYG